MSRDTGNYYDLLERWTSMSRLVGYGGGRNTLTVHRALADPSAGGRPTATRLHDLLLETLPPLNVPRVLDAGCGLGGTMLDFASRVSGTYTGLTLSERQAQIGRRAIVRARLEASIEILVSSYDTPPARHFDVTLAIESLAHSSDPGASLRALASRLAPGGLLAIVDDMPELPARGSKDLAVFKAGWRLPVLWSAAEFMAGMADCGLTLVTNRDLTPDVRPRSLAQIERLETLNRRVHRLAPLAGLRAMLDSYHGGLALERLYRQGLMKYRLLIARRRGTEI
jgi:SAM-dependent methyltransferase